MWWCRCYPCWITCYMAQWSCLVFCCRCVAILACTLYVTRILFPSCRQAVVALVSTHRHSACSLCFLRKGWSIPTARRSSLNFNSSLSHVFSVNIMSSPPYIKTPAQPLERAWQITTDPWTSTMPQSYGAKMSRTSIFVQYIPTPSHAHPNRLNRLWPRRRPSLFAIGRILGTLVTRKKLQTWFRAPRKACSQRHY